ncbi:MAG TPA: hypothetical protein ENK57_15385 [Polyangiaceae bacterium]|nr:hypothetical protein [Polyangiaceae bacterium]
MAPVTSSPWRVLPIRLVRLLALVLAIGLVLVVSPAAARTVRITEVDASKSPDPKVERRIEKTLTRLLKRATRRAKWGKGDKVELSARVVKLSYEESEDVLRVSVTVVAKIAGGKGARSHIRLGGRPSKRHDVEKDALKIVADGLITRLSAIARGEKGD